MSSDDRATAATTRGEATPAAGRGDGGGATGPASSDGSHAPHPRALRNAGVVVHGVVFDGQWRRVAHPFLDFRSRDGSSRRVIGNDSGEYVTTELPRGEWVVTAAQRGYVRDAHVLVVGPGTGELLRLDFQLAAARRVPVRLVDADGHKLEERLARKITVVVTRSPLAARALPLFRGDDSRAGSAQYVRAGTRFPDVDVPDEFAGTLVLAAPPPLTAYAVAGRRILASQPIDASTEHVILTVQAQSVDALTVDVRLRVTDERGSPLPKARIALDPWNRGGVAPVVSLEDGVAILRQQPSGLLLLRVTALGREEATRFVHVQPPSPCDLGTIRLAAPGRIRAVLKTESGKIVRNGGILVRNASRWNRDYPLETHRRSRAAKDGVVTITRLGRGPHVLVAEATGYALRAQEVSVPAGDVVDVVFRMKAGVRVRLEPGRDEFPPLVTILDQQGRAVFGEYLTDPRAVTLSAGQYTVVTRRYTGDVVEKSFVVGNSPRAVVVTRY